MTPTDPADVVRHEQHLHVRTETVPVETVRIEKFIVTERRTFTADVRREELRITREHITGNTSVPTATPNNRALPIVIVLHEEQIEITTTVVPVEKITVNVAHLIGERHLNASVQREQVDVDENRLP